MARHMRNGRDYSRPGPKVDYELRKGSNNAARSGKVYDKFEEVNTRLTQSFVEHEVGTYIDASGISHKMYEKTFNCGALPDNDVKNIPFNSTYSKILSISGIAYSIQGHSTAIPAAWKVDRKLNTLTAVLVYVAEGNVRINTFSDMSDFYTTSEVTVRYIKD